MYTLSGLLDFLLQKMSMADVYQPAVILHLLERGGQADRADLSRTLSGYDEAVQEYYDKILMRWPKRTLLKHKLVSYDPKSTIFRLNVDLNDAALLERAKDVCERKIRDWIERKSLRRGTSKIEASTRFRVLKAARGKCELCGISSKVSPIDIDHIVPRSHADRQGYVLKDGLRLSVDDERNLQALCYRCNRAKRDQDTTDWRQPVSRIVRERAVPYIAGSPVTTRTLKGDELRDKLFDKLVEEHARLIDKDSAEPLLDRAADMLEALIAVAKAFGASEEEVLALVRKKREEQGGFDAGTYLVG